VPRTRPQPNEISGEGHGQCGNSPSKEGTHPIPPQFFQIQIRFPDVFDSDPFLFEPEREPPGGLRTIPSLSSLFLETALTEPVFGK